MFMKATLIRILFCVAFSSLALGQGTLLPPPSNLNGRFRGEPPSRITLTWQAPLGEWFFRLYRSIGDTSAFHPIGLSAYPQFDDFEVSPVGNYWYQVTTVGFGDTVESQPSNRVMVSTGNFVPHPKGTISGIVTVDGSGQPIPLVHIRFYRTASPWSVVLQVLTSESGHYEAMIDTGSYLIRAETGFEGGVMRFRPEWFDDVTEPVNATPVPVGTGTQTNASFALQPMAPPVMVDVAGTVRSETTSEPIAGATVAVLRSMQEMNYIGSTSGNIPGVGPEAGVIPGVGYTRGIVWKGSTNAQGQYLAHVPAGMYVLLAVRQGFLPEFAVDHPDPTEADIFELRVDTSGIDFALSPLGTTPNAVHGVVRDSTATTVPSRVILFPRPVGSTTLPVRFAHADTNGIYEIDNVAAGSYNVLAIPFSDFGPAFYKEGRYGIATWQESDTITVGGSAPAVNVGVVPVASAGLTRVTGVMRSTSNDPIVGGSLVATSSTGEVVGYAISGSDGSYTIDALRSGAVELVVNRTGFAAGHTSLNIPPNTFSVTNVDFMVGPEHSTGVVSSDQRVMSFALSQNFPNPFNPTTRILFSVPGAETQVVSLRLYDLLGRTVAVLAEGPLSPGDHSVVFDASGLSAGVYYYRLVADGFVAVRSLVLLK